jgi:Helix-hairpin-helix motif
MMMVMTMMRVELHLRDNPKEGVAICQIFCNKFCCEKGWLLDECRVQNGLMQLRIWMFGWLFALIIACASSNPANGEWKNADLVDVNHASVPELMRVPGMTESWAARIVRFRPYRTKLDLLQEGVVPAEVYYRIREGIIAHHVGK